MPDPIFADPRLATVYDAFDGPRNDLALYVDLIADGSPEVVDVGCGTGSLALLLTANGCRVTGLDPAAASLDVARRKPGADAVHWVQGEVLDLPGVAAYDVAVLAGNVAQVFPGDAWPAVLAKLYAVIRPGGRLIFETRRPEACAWQDWAAAPPTVVEHVPGVGEVEQRFELLVVQLPSVSFRWSYRFSDGTRIDSDSTLAFRDQEQVETGLRVAGFQVLEVGEAPDRPGQELVFVARRPPSRPPTGQRSARAEA